MFLSKKAPFRHPSHPTPSFPYSAFRFLFLPVLGENGTVIPNLRVLSLALMLAPCLAAAQSFTANGPFETGHFAPLNGHQRWLRWASEDGGSADLHLQSFASAAYLQAIADPAAWNRSTGGFVRRLGSSYGANIVQNSVHDSLSAAEGTDPRYFSCACSGFFHRSGHALRMTFFTYGRGGRETIDVLARRRDLHHNAVGDHRRHLSLRRRRLPVRTVADAPHKSRGGL